MAEVQPGYAADESAKSGYVRIKVKIDGLKAKSQGFLGKLFGSHPLPVGKNAVIENPDFHSRGFNLCVKGEQGGAMKGDTYRLQIKQLPYDIDVAYSYLTAEDGWIFVFLKKADVNVSWESYLRGAKLETA